MGVCGGYYEGKVHMKTLYVSDLDGTLLDSSAEFPAPWRDRLNALLENGLPFTIASARSSHSAPIKLEGVHFRLPSILINGAQLYDWEEQKTLRLATLSDNHVRTALEIYERHRLAPVTFSLDEHGAFHNSYRTLNGGVYDGHFGTQVREGDPRFRKVADYRIAYERERCFHITTLALPEETAAAFAELLAAGVPCSIYDDVYTGGRFLECGAADKGSTALELKRMLGAEELVAIGDNLNDIPMLQAADRAVVVQGGHPDALAVADEVIGPCAQGGVLDFLEREWKKPER